MLFYVGSIGDVIKGPMDQNYLPLMDRKKISLGNLINGEQDFPNCSFLYYLLED